MNQETGEFTRREVLRSAVAIPTAVVLSSCEVLFPPKPKPESRVDEALGVFFSSDLKDEPRWKYHTLTWMPMQVDLPPGWEHSGINVGEGATSIPLTEMSRIFSKPREFNKDIWITLITPLKEGVTQEVFSRNRIEREQEYWRMISKKWNQDVEMKDVRVSDIKLSSFNQDKDATLFSYFLRGIQYHRVIIVRGRKAWEIEFRGIPEYVVKEMPKFRRMVDSIYFKAD